MRLRRYRASSARPATTGRGRIAAVVAVGCAALGLAVAPPAPAGATPSSPSTRPTTPATHLPAGVMPKAAPAPHTAAAPAGAHLNYYGGKVIPNVSVVQVLYGSGTYEPEVQNTAAPSIASFYGGVTNSSYLDMLSEYNTTGVVPVDGGPSSNQSIGRGSFAGQVSITPAAANNASTIDDSNIQAELTAQVRAGSLPTPNGNTLFAVYFPHGKTITQGGSSSGVRFCAYHGTVAAGTTPEFYYSVLPDFTTGGMASGCGSSLTEFGNVTSVSSHEMAEATTDAEVGIGTTVSRPLAWYDATNGENGDICNAQQQNIVGGDGRTYTVQQEFSNLQNACVVGPPATANDFSIGVSPTSATVSAGSAASATVSTAVTAGAPATVSLSASGLPGGATASFSPTSITSGSSSTLNIGTTSGTPAGTYPVTISGVEGPKTHTTTLSLTVTASAGNNFSIAASPTGATVAAGSSATATVSTAVTAGSAASVSLGTSGAPSGVSASLNPTSVTAGGSSTLTVSTTAGTSAGSYTITVTGTEGQATHSTTFALTVTSGGGSSGLVNGGFETGALGGWTPTGSTAAVNSGAQSGTYAARVGSTGPSTDSSLSQTFTVPATATGISFWYNVICPDSVTYDWATATLKDNTTGTTATPLARVCVNPSSGWKQVTASATAGHSVTLTLSSHDDNYGSDPTYTLYDSVAVTTGGGGGGGGIANGGFENGTLTGWTASGAATSVTTTSHSGTYAAMAGSTTATNGDSTISQTFTVPSGKSQLSMWYANKCPDTVSYDWVTVTLKDNTTATTATLVAKSCAASYTWTNATGPVTAGHSYTLNLTSHDDNYGSDPTYTLFDDLTLN